MQHQERSTEKTLPAKDHDQAFPNALKHMIYTIFLPCDKHLRIGIQGGTKPIKQERCNEGAKLPLL